LLAVTVTRVCKTVEPAEARVAIHTVLAPAPLTEVKWAAEFTVPVIPLICATLNWANLALALVATKPATESTAALRAIKNFVCFIKKIFQIVNIAYSFLKVFSFPFDLAIESRYYCAIFLHRFIEYSSDYLR
jgi:hypothetical protein